MAEATQIISDTIFAVRGAFSRAYPLIPSGQQRADFNTLGVTINDWATRRAGWAANGVRADGTSYTLERWVTEGQGYADDASYRAGLASDSSTFSLLIATARDIPSHLQGDLTNAYTKVTSPTAWPWYLQVGVAGVGLFYASQIWANFRGRK